MKTATGIYKDGDTFVIVGKAAKGFDGVVFTTREGATPDALTEAVRTADQIKALESINIETLSQGWQEALGAKSKPQPKPSKPRAQPQKAQGPMVNVIETHYVRMNPNLAKSSVLFFMGLAILSVLTGIAFNGAFMVLCVGGALLAVLYQCAIATPIEVKREQI